MMKTIDPTPNSFTSPAFRARLKQRETEALGQFFEHYFDQIYRYVRGMVRNEHTAEDLTQDIFVNLQRSLDGFDPERQLDPWVFTIATNRVRDFWRSRHHQDSRTQLSLDDEEGLVDALAREEVPSDALEERETNDLVMQAIDQLSEKNRSAVLLRSEGLPFEAIGRSLGSNEVAVRKRYSRAIETLRDILVDSDTFEPEPCCN